MSDTLSRFTRNDLPELTAMRRFLHSRPELGLEEVETSDFVAARLVEYGYDVHRGLARTGLVATLKSGDSGRTVGLRADMDALPIDELTGLPHASEKPGLMHACGHDGHMTMLLGAAKMLAERRAFDGTVHLIFQPAEENAGGGQIMVEEGLFDLFPCDAIFAAHNEPALPFGQFALREGPIMAAVDEAFITVRGRGGHGASPETTADPIVAGASIVMALQTIVARNIHPIDPSVITVAAFHGGTASNIIPETVELVVGIRSFDEGVRDQLETRIREVARGQAESYGLTVDVVYQRSYGATINNKAETDFLRDVARRYAGIENVVDLDRPFMGSEDFAYMLDMCPGSYFFLGTGATPDDPPLHHPKYDFNDDILPIGAAFWVELAETFLARETL